MQETLLSFGNARRRFEVWADVDGIRVVDDYAHHPTEIRATLAAAREEQQGGGSSRCSSRSGTPAPTG